MSLAARDSGIIIYCITVPCNELAAAWPMRLLRLLVALLIIFLVVRISARAARCALASLTLILGLLFSLWGGAVSTQVSPLDWERRDYFMSHWHPGKPQGLQCGELVRLGREGDGGKTICLDLQPPPRECTVLSIGSNGDFSFEDAVHGLAPQCDVHTYDGTMGSGSRARMVQSAMARRKSWLTFHHANLEADTVRQLPDTVGRRLWTLKIDCEGCEFSELLPILQAVCVDIVLLEIHKEPIAQTHAFLQGLNRTHGIYYAEANLYVPGLFELAYRRRLGSCPEPSADRTSRVGGRGDKRAHVHSRPFALPTRGQSASAKSAVAGRSLQSPMQPTLTYRLADLVVGLIAENGTHVRWAAMAEGYPKSLAARWIDRMRAGGRQEKQGAPKYLAQAEAEARVLARMGGVDALTMRGWCRWVRECGGYALVKTLLDAQPARSVPPPANAMLIHLRLGDVIDGCDCTADDLWDGASQLSAVHTVRPYVRDGDYFRRFLPYARGRPVVIVGSSSHKDTAFLRRPGGWAVGQSAAYTQLVKDLFLREGHALSVTVRGSVKGPPYVGADDDLLFLSRGAVLLTTGGGYSRLAGYMALMSGGIVLGENMHAVFRVLPFARWFSRESRAL